MQTKKFDRTILAMGCKRASDADHIRRDVNAYNAAIAAMVLERQQLEEAMRLRALGIEPPGKASKKGEKKKKK